MRGPAAEGRTRPGPAGGLRPPRCGSGAGAAGRSGRRCRRSVSVGCSHGPGAPWAVLRRRGRKQAAAGSGAWLAGAAAAAESKPQERRRVWPRCASKRPKEGSMLRGRRGTAFLPFISWYTTVTFERSMKQKQVVWLVRLLATPVKPGLNVYVRSGCRTQSLMIVLGSTPFWLLTSAGYCGSSYCF